MELDDLNVIWCIALRDMVPLGMCRKLCKWYSLDFRNDDKEDCGYPAHKLMMPHVSK